MKKLIITLFIMCLTLLAACGGEDTNNDDTDKSGEEQQNDETESSEEEDSDSINVEKDSSTVEITLPADFVESEEGSVDEIINDAKEEGIDKVEQNDDGSLTYLMSKEKHDEMMEELKTNMNSTVEELVNSGEYSSIEDIEANENFDEFTVKVDQEAFENSMDGFATMTLGISGTMYQAFNGVSEDEMEVVINIQNNETDEVFDTITYPEAMEEMDENN